MASPTDHNEPKIPLKLMLHREKKKVIFAEADCHFVDTLFSFMTLPLGTITRLLAKQPDEKLKPLQSLQNVYKSLMDLPPDYFSAEESKFVMLNPRTSSDNICRKLKLNIDDTEPTKYHLCSKYFYHKLDFSTSKIARCSECGSLMNWCILKNDYTTPTSVDENVFSSNLTSFIVTDDLRVMPYTSGFIFQLFSDHEITESSLIEELTIDIGLDQIVILLNLALRFKYPLTYLVYSLMGFSEVLCYLTPEISVQDIVCNKIETSSKRLILNVNLQKSTSRFLFAEADSNFVEFLFSFLEIPLGTLIGKLFNGSSSLQGADNLYASISNMNVGEGIKSQDRKDMLLQPQLVLKYPSVNKMFTLDYVSSPVNNKLHGFCYKFKDPRIQESYLKSSPAKFMVTDDLVITPITSTSTVALLTRLKVPLNDLEIHKVDIGIEEGLKILKASLTSVSTLTDSLLKKCGPTKK